MYFVGLDIGTTSICGVLIDAAEGTVVKSLNVPNRSSLLSDKIWEKIQDPDSILANAARLMANFSGVREQIAAIGVTGQMHGILYTDRKGNAVSPLYTWQDQRGNLPCEDGSATYAARLSEQTGYIVSPGFGLVTHDYNIRNGLVPENAAFLCTIGDYVAMKLARSSTPVMDGTNAASLGLFRTATMEFDTAAMDKAGIGSHLLPPLVPSGTVIGETEHGIPVVAALGDNQASFLGSVRSIRDTLLVNVGTGGQISAYTSGRELEDSLKGKIDLRPFPGGGYLLVGASLSGGKSYALLEQFFREVCIRFAGYKGPGLYEQMNDLALECLKRDKNAGNYADIPPADHLTVHTQFYGTRSDALRRGSIEGISPENFTPGRLTVSFLEGIARELYEFYRLFPQDVRERMRTMVGSGNGIRQNAALRVVLHRMFRYPLHEAPYQEEAAVGAALCAGVGTGFFSDFFSAGKRWIKEAD